MYSPSAIAQALLNSSQPASKLYVTKHKNQIESRAKVSGLVLTPFFVLHISELAFQAIQAAPQFIH
ncbi:MAG: hypothetical protein AAF808_07410, partial [Cyanobacteria bacterium P01_D01_bin.2]